MIGVWVLWNVTSERVQCIVSLCRCGRVEEIHHSESRTYHWSACVRGDTCRLVIEQDLVIDFLLHRTVFCQPITTRRHGASIKTQCRALLIEPVSACSFAPDRSDRVAE